MSATLQRTTETNRVSEDAARSGEIARRQALYRDVNEQIRLIAENVELEDHLDFVCECANCSFDRLILTRQDYDAIRRFPTRFLVKPGHDARDEERVVEESAGYAVVEKVGAGAQIAIQLDSRRKDGRPRRST